MSEYDEARAWLGELEWADMEPEDIASLPDSVAKRAVARHYDGGWDAFLADCVGVSA